MTDAACRPAPPATPEALWPGWEEVLLSPPAGDDPARGWFRGVYARARAMTYSQYEYTLAERDRLAGEGLTRELPAADLARLREAAALCRAYLDWTFNISEAAVTPPARVRAGSSRRANRRFYSGR